MNNKQMVDLMLQAFAEASGAAVAAIIRRAVVESITNSLKMNDGIRERYNVIYGRLLRESGVIPLTPREKREKRK